MFQSLADCPACRVQGAVVETWDPAANDTSGPVPTAVALSSLCRMCARTLERGREVKAADRLERIADVEAALLRWAKNEGFDSARELVEANFVVGTVPKLHAALILGEPIETSFDVVGFLFSHAGGAVPGRMDEPVTTEKLVARPPTARLDALGERAFTPRNELLALASVALADGALVAEERAFLETHGHGQAPLTAEELRVHRPDEVGPVGGLLDRERVLEKMVKCACVDGEIDDSEVRVLRGFARAWGVDPARVERWLHEGALRELGPLGRLQRTFARHLFPEA